MGMNETPSGERIQIGIFGKTNAGKSSLINAITGQDLAIVSQVKGTTTDPVKKAMELLPLGPVVLIDTPGLDDESTLGQKRMEKSIQMLRMSDVAIFVVDVSDRDWHLERELLQQAKEKNQAYLVVINKTDQLEGNSNAPEILNQREKELVDFLEISKDSICTVSARECKGIYELKEAITHLVPQEKEHPLVKDLLSPKDVVVLVVPIDSAAPKGRLILPQQQTIRDILEAGAIPAVTRETELLDTLRALRDKPRLVITDSQAFEQVAKQVPRDVPLTSFSILMARYKGDLSTQIEGAKAIEQLKDGDMVLISEGCTHHRQCGDIGTEKMPRWISEYTGKRLEYRFTSGGEFPQDLSPYAMVVHCGGCTLPVKEMRYRISHGSEQEVPITNYGVLIAYIHGILPRVVEPFEK
ncbi:MAG: [FeFe] hydrogenase H-cluster maturation GTPase HydF [Lachnospiraceae bacterium]|nr:[FeFe] hydrogenase H-cluster maturation GTPase HydF [Lachnospiraceae bacterium]